jgi:hypothetical protein
VIRRVLLGVIVVACLWTIVTMQRERIKVPDSLDPIVYFLPDHD